MRIGVLVGFAEDDPEAKEQLTGFRQGLQSLGWSEDRNVQIDLRYGAGRIDQFGVLAKELVTLRRDVILAQGTANTAVVQRESHGIPVVFVNVSDFIGSGFVANLARPSGNVTGFLMYEAGITGKWLAMLKEIAPYLTRVALLVGPLTATNHFVQAAAAAQSLAIELVPSRVENAADIERVIESFARVPKGGLLVPPDNTTIAHRDLVIALAARDRLPAVYSLRLFVRQAA